MLCFHDGATTGPNWTCSGLIGKQIGMALWPIVQFAPVKGHVRTLPEWLRKSFSCDQVNLYHASLVIQEGPASFSSALAGKNPCTVS